MPLAIVIAFIVGAVCAVRLPVLIFTLIVALVVVVFAVTSHGLGDSIGSSVLWGLAYAAALEAGYVFAHCLFYMVYVRRSSREDKQPSAKITSRYPSE
ncbi:hypothetical protein J5277_22315 [Rhizobium sp. 16-449-1b]|uniref:hypothetical protein n=1 Tax=Rhizobium sp. 16-449-1b TaxID=2819989 RepID=UPI000645654D|nr:hypothetical protein [Rhizobium sp. 16-449-1b]MBO9196849.1 hypothetical protein [Rhizobium sp. 16-449-1b]